MKCKLRQCTVFDEEKLNRRREELEAEEQSPSIYGDPDKLKRVGKEKRAVCELLQKIEQTGAQLQDLYTYYDLLQEAGGDEREVKEFEREYQVAKRDIEGLFVETLYSEPHDSCDAIVELHAGAGGEEAQDWTDMLERMYSRFGELKNYDVKILDYEYGDGAGYKSVTLLFEGSNAYGNFKCERGVHRLVRISPFDANKRRHTSFASVEVSPVVEEDSGIVVRAEDIKVDTFRSGGAGGQHINKTESAVRITHIPTGIVVACQNERSQTQNKEYAMKMLKAKLAERQEKEREAERLKKLGLQMKIEWGSQIRSYVLCPYTMVKDHRTGYETGDAQSVLDGNIENFIIEKLKFDKKNA